MSTVEIRARYVETVNVGRDNGEQEKEAVQDRIPSASCYDEHSEGWKKDVDADDHDSIRQSSN
jgi:hypothetical protein